MEAPKVPVALEALYVAEESYGARPVSGFADAPWRRDDIVAYADDSNLVTGPLQHRLGRAGTGRWLGRAAGWDGPLPHALGRAAAARPGTGRWLGRAAAAQAGTGRCCRRAVAQTARCR